MTKKNADLVLIIREEHICAVLGCPIVGKSFAVRLTLAYDFDILSRLPNIGWEIAVFWNNFANQVGQLCPSCGTIIRPRKRISMEHWEKVKRTPIKTLKKTRTECVFKSGGEDWKCIDFITTIFGAFLTKLAGPYMAVGLSAWGGNTVNKGPNFS